MTPDEALAAIDDYTRADDMTPDEALAAIGGVVNAYFTITDPATVPPYK